MKKDNIYNLFNNLYIKHGKSPKSVKNISKKQQNIRFFYLFNSLNIKKTDKILDLGCGFGDMLKFLRKNKIGKSYVGYDYLEDFIFHAKKEFQNDKNAKFELFDLRNQKINKKYDWVVASGLFHDIRHNSRKFFFKTIKKMYSSCNKGIVFNAMTDHVDYKDPSLFYLSPEKVINYIIKNISKKVFYRSDYQTKKNTIPYEFTVCVKKYDK
tara:strand:+ start:1024 stop:1656 length:633 start_codon:yes stop_codon:yes gene_type:complete